MSIPNIPNTQGASRARPAAGGALDLPGGSSEPGPPAPGPALQAPHNGPAVRARSVRLAAVLARDGQAGLAPRSSLGDLPRRSGAEEVRQGRPHPAAVPPQRGPFEPLPSLPSSSQAALPAPQGRPLAAPQDMPQPSLGGQDQRSHEEIRRTRVLHRPGPNLGPGDLPALRAGLGRQGTPEQRERALSYAPLLGQAVTRARMYLDLAPGDTRRSESLEALRTSARHIQERAEDDYEQDCIMGTDFDSIMQYLAILFRAVDG